MKKQQFKSLWPGLMILLLVCFHISVSNAQISPGTYTIKSKLAANKNLDVQNANKAQGARIHLWSTNNGEAQRFIITPSNEAGYYHIKTEWGFCLGVGASNPNPGAHVVTWACINNLDDQKWKFTDTGDGHYNIQSKLRTYIDVKNANTADGAEIVMNGYSTWNGNIAERWKLEKVVSPVRGSKIEVSFRSGDDDLRSYNNAFMTINFYDGSSSSEIHLLRGLASNRSTAKIYDLGLIVNLENIRSIRIRHDGTPNNNPFDGGDVGHTYDNWDLKILIIDLVQLHTGIRSTIFRGANDVRGGDKIPIRFTGEKRTAEFWRQF